MDSLAHCTLLEELYLKARVNELYIPEISIQSGTARISQLANKQFFHAAGALHGSVLFKLLDDAAFFAANSVVADYFVLTGTFRVEFLRPVSSGRMHATGQLKRREDRKLWAQSELKDEEDKLLARGEGIFIVSKIKLEDL